MVGGSVGKRGAEMERGSGGGLVGRRKGQWRGISLRALGRGGGEVKLGERHNLPNYG